MLFSNRHGGDPNTLSCEASLKRGRRIILYTEEDADNLKLEINTQLLRTRERREGSGCLRIS